MYHIATIQLTIVCGSLRFGYNVVLYAHDMITNYSTNQNNHQFKQETINTGPRTEDWGPKDQGCKNVAVLHLAFMTEIQLVSMF